MTLQYKIHNQSKRVYAPNATSCQLSIRMSRRFRRNRIIWIISAYVYAPISTHQAVTGNNSDLSLEFPPILWLFHSTQPKVPFAVRRHNRNIVRKHDLGSVRQHQMGIIINAVIVLQCLVEVYLRYSWSCNAAK